MGKGSTEFKWVRVITLKRGAWCALLHPATVFVYIVRKMAFLYRY